MERDSVRQASGETMQVTTLAFFRFEGFWNQFWAFFQMGLAKRHVRRLPGVGFYKLMGTGRRSGFDPAPNFGIYACLVTWDSMETARTQVRQSAVFERFRARAVESWVVFLSAARSRGSWDRKSPFAVESTLPPGEPVGILTRASIARRRLIRFWKSVPEVSGASFESAALRFNIGLGEWPVVRLMTFSVWDDFSAAKAYAYHDGAHRRTMERARAEGWFAEELFVRFRVLDAVGTWYGVNPLAEGLESSRESAA